MAVCSGEEYNVEKREWGSNIIVPIMLRLLDRISSEERGLKFLGSKSKLKKIGVGKSCRELYTPLDLELLLEERNDLVSRLDKEELVTSVDAALQVGFHRIS